MNMAIIALIEDNSTSQKTRSMNREKYEPRFLRKIESGQRQMGCHSSDVYTKKIHISENSYPSRTIQVSFASLPAKLLSNFDLYWFGLMTCC